jgi:mono/diheme cytochrome c family protein
MKKIFKWIGIVLGVLSVLVIVLAGSMFAMGSAQLTKTYDVQPGMVTIPKGEEALERGAYLYAASCASCHGDDLAGKAILDDPSLGYLPAKVGDGLRGRTPPFAP